MGRTHPVQDRITGFWSTVAPEYEAHGGNVPARGSAEFDAWVAAISRLLPAPPADVLDVATGTGFAACIAARLGHRVIAIDLAEPMLAEARKAAAEDALEIRFELRDAVAPALPPQSLDAILCRHFIWTLREPETALRSWLALLRPGGRVVAIDGFWFRDAAPTGAPDPGAPNLFDRYYTAETRAALPAMGFSSPRSVAALFERAGFARVEVGDLADVHALAAAPSSPEPWYVVVARR